MLKNLETLGVSDDAFGFLFVLCIILQCIHLQQCLLKCPEYSITELYLTQERAFDQKRPAFACCQETVESAKIGQGAAGFEVGRIQPGRKGGPFSSSHANKSWQQRLLRTNKLGRRRLLPVLPSPFSLSLFSPSMFGRDTKRIKVPTTTSRPLSHFGLEAYMCVCICCQNFLVAVPTAE